VLLLRLRLLLVIIATRERKTCSDQQNAVQFTAPTVHAHSRYIFARAVVTTTLP
jgi:hypothetical protein